MAHDYNEDMSLGYHDLPNARERAAMSVLALAEDLARREEGSPAHIVLSHELNLKLSKEQAKATLSAGWLSAGATVLAVFIAAGLGYLAGASQAKEPAPAASAVPPKQIEAPAVGGNVQKPNEPSDKNAKP